MYEPITFIMFRKRLIIYMVSTNSLTRLKCRCDKTVVVKIPMSLECPIIIRTTTDCDNGSCDYEVFHHLHSLVDILHVMVLDKILDKKMEVQQTNIYCLIV